MKRSIAMLAAVLCLGPALADEGMWPPRQLPEIADELKKAGLELKPGSLSRLTEHPMNAVIDLGGCTASFVSPQGLIVTNHHCSWGTLQYNSTADRNLMEQGFLAASLAEEVPAAPGSRVRVTVDVEDVTDAVAGGLDPSLDGAERYRQIENREKKLIAKCEEDAGHRCRVRSFYGGLEYQLVKQLEIRDVRLVYAPPGSIGVFGGDIDNWTWPRHTGDYSFLRAYVGPDGKPAEPAEDNVPYEPVHWLRLSPRGVGPGDYVMVVGYPGRTNRYRLATEVESSFGWFYPQRRELLQKALAVIEESTTNRPDAAIKYASFVAGINNTTKNYQGMLEGFARGDMLERKRRLEAELQSWIAASDERSREHARTLATLEQLVAREQATRERDMVLGLMARISMPGTARRLYRLAREREKPDADREPGYQQRDMAAFRDRLQRIDRRYDAEVDKALWRLTLDAYLELPAAQRIPAFDAALGLDELSTLDARLDRMYAESRLGDAEVRLSLMEADRATLEASADPFLQLAAALYDSDLALEAVEEALEGEFQLARSRYMETLIAFLSANGRAVYPDANSSLRVTYGTVRGYSPRDGLRYTPFTRLEGIVEKYTGAHPFDSPPQQLERIAAGDHGRYAMDSLGSVPVNFLSNADTTGGNSGSPTLNGRGELVGLLFDGVWESINADWAFDDRTSRAIHVDIRYVLWVMEKVDGARRVLDELGLPAP